LNAAAVFLFRVFTLVFLQLDAHRRPERQPLAEANWVGNVYHGLPAELFALNQKPEGYLAFLGRISPEKRVDRAIEIAKRAGCRLKIAAKIDEREKNYFGLEIKHLMDDPLIEFVGEIGGHEKQEFLGNAAALVFRSIGRNPLAWF
jgi:glycosyltransferase involved in cell wall biosynthesis